MAKTETSKTDKNNETTIPLARKEELTEEQKLEIDLKRWAEQLSGEDDAVKSAINPSYPALMGPAPDYGFNISSVRKSPRQNYILYLTNQFIFRAINIRSDKVVSRGYELKGGDARGREECQKLLKNSGDIQFIKQLSINADIGGITFVEKLPNKTGTKIAKLKHLNPISVGFKRDKTTGMIILDKNGQPAGYVQYYVKPNGEMVEEDITAKDRIVSFKFNTLGDEFDGVSIIQPVYDTVIRLMNMEYAAAIAAVRTANPLLVGKCNTKSPNLIKEWSKILGNISGKDQIFLPEGMELDMISPGQQQFSEYSQYFLNAVVAATGVPESILLGKSESGNRAETIALSKNFNEMMRINQLSIENFINKIFEEFGLLSGFEPPVFSLVDISEDTSVTAELIIELVKNGIITVDEARDMLDIPALKKKMDTTDAEIKKSDMKTYFPSEGVSPEGSQKGIKKTQKVSPYSEVNPIITK